MVFSLVQIILPLYEVCYDTNLFYGYQEKIIGQKIEGETVELVLI